MVPPLARLLVVLLSCFAVSSVEAQSSLSPAPFEQDVMAVLSRSGCNQGTCHGNQHGKGGLKLSLRGQDAKADFRELTRTFGGRRINLLDPAASLFLQKPLMLVPHEGGRRFAVDSPEHAILLRWIEAGLPADPSDAPQVLRLQVTPQLSTRVAGGEPVQIQALAQLSDGTTRDVTSLAVYDSSSLIMNVSADGVVSSSVPGLTTVTVRYLTRQAAVRLEFIADRPDFVFEAPQPRNMIDELVYAQLARLRMNPSPVCDDTTFLRRAYLDLTGLLPPVNEAREFLESSASDKRSALIDQLLASEEFVDQQTQRWADLLRAEEKTLDEKGLAAYHGWIRERVAANQPLNEFVAELIAARGSSYQVPATNLYRALRTTEDRAEATAQMFLGVRLTCAKCHNHPFDHWTQDDYYGWSNFFARIDYEIVENKRRDKSDLNEFVGEQIIKIATKGDVKNPRTGKTARLRFLGTETSEIEETDDHDRLQILAEWLSDPGNRVFAATQANRLWFQLLGQGVVDPIDDFRATNPPVNPELLEALTTAFIDSNFDTRQMLRLIMNSQIYQSSSVPNESNMNDDVSFSHVIPRRLTAEQTLDAIARTLDADVPFGGHEMGTRAVQLVGVRNGEFRYAKPLSGDNFLKLFGKPNRLQSCECERSNETTLAQTFEMLGGEAVSQLLNAKDNRLARALNSDQTAVEFVNELYWSALTRPPGAAELEQLSRYIDTQEDRRNALEDVTWAVMNSNEFLLRR